MGEGVKRPTRTSVVTIEYRAYFYDHTEFDTSKEKKIKLTLDDRTWPEGLRKAIE